MKGRRKICAKEILCKNYEYVICEYWNSNAIKKNDENAQVMHLKFSEVFLLEI